MGFRRDPDHIERLAGLVLVPVVATIAFYGLPGPLRSQAAVQLLPQAVGYLALLLWAVRNHAPLWKLGLRSDERGPALLIGLATGSMLGAVNLAVIVIIVPAFGGDIAALRETPHARVPLLVMVPWGIALIATLAEVLFRGFVLGRLHVVCEQAGLRRRAGRLAVLLSALLFCFDPFIVMTFDQLHWIALWDGIVWGWLWMRWQNVVLTIVAHAVEVILLYTVLRSLLSA